MNLSLCCVIDPFRKNVHLHSMGFFGGDFLMFDILINALMTALVLFSWCSISVTVRIRTHSRLQLMWTFYFVLALNLTCCR